MFRRFSVSLLFFACVCSSFASDTNTVDRYQSYSNAVETLALKLASGEPTRAVDYQQLIYSLLQSYFDNYYNDGVWYTLPVDSSTGVSLSDFLGRGIFNGYTSGQDPSSGDSYLRAIARGLNGSSNGMYVNDSGGLLPTASQISSKLDSVLSSLATSGTTNLSSQLDNIYTVLQSQNSALASMLSSYFPYFQSDLSSISSHTYDIWDSVNWYQQFLYDSGLWHTHVDDAQWSAMVDSIESILDALSDLGADTSSYFDNTATHIDDFDETLKSVLDEIEYISKDFNSLVTDSDQVPGIYSNTLEHLQLVEEHLVPDVEHIDNDFHLLLSWATNDTVIDGFNASRGITNAPTYSQQKAEWDSVAQAEESVETGVTHDLSEYSTSASYALPELSYHGMIPGDTTPFRYVAPDFGTPQLQDDYNIPILSDPLIAGSLTIRPFSVDFGTGSTYRRVMDDFGARIGPIMVQIWNLAFAIAVLLLVKYEWNHYMSAIAPSDAIRKSQETTDYDGFAL